MFSVGGVSYVQCGRVTVVVFSVGGVSCMCSVWEELVACGRS